MITGWTGHIGPCLIVVVKVCIMCSCPLDPHKTRKQKLRAIWGCVCVARVLIWQTRGKQRQDDKPTCEEGLRLLMCCGSQPPACPLFLNMSLVCMRPLALRGWTQAPQSATQHWPVTQGHSPVTGNCMHHPKVIVYHQEMAAFVGSTRTIQIKHFCEAF